MATLIGTDKRGGYEYEYLAISAEEMRDYAGPGPKTDGAARQATQRDRWGSLPPVYVVEARTPDAGYSIAGMAGGGGRGFAASFHTPYDSPPAPFSSVAVAREWLEREIKGWHHFDVPAFRAR